MEARRLPGGVRAKKEATDLRAGGSGSAAINGFLISELLISSRNSRGDGEIELPPHRTCAGRSGSARLEHAATAVADLSGWNDPYHAATGFRLPGRESDLSQWPLAGIPAR